LFQIEIVVLTFMTGCLVVGEAIFGHIPVFLEEASLIAKRKTQSRLFR